jgi:hypothetical protein
LVYSFFSFISWFYYTLPAMCLIIGNLDEQSFTETSKTVSQNKPSHHISWLPQVFVTVTEIWLTHLVSMW